MCVHTSAHTLFKAEVEQDLRFKVEFSDYIHQEHTSAGRRPTGNWDLLDREVCTILVFPEVLVWEQLQRPSPHILKSKCLTEDLVRVSQS